MVTERPHPEITLLTPMYNESVGIRANVTAIKDVLDALDVVWEYILVDDGSTDDSVAIAREAFGDDERCRIIHYARNRGRGYALRRGFAAARGKYVITTESDLSWGAAVARSLYNAIREGTSDIVIASTYLPGGGYENVPLRRRLLSSWGNVVMRWAFGGKLTMLSGMTRAYRHEVVKSLYLESDRKEIHLEIIAKAQAMGFSISEIPATIRWSTERAGSASRGAGGMGKFIVPHLLSSFGRAASRTFFYSSVLSLLLGAALVTFGVLNKLFMLTSERFRLPNIITYGLILIAIGTVIVLFAGLSFQIATLYRSMVHMQSQLQGSRRSDEPGDVSDQFGG